jgi:hypothetical protein
MNEDEIKIRIREQIKKGNRISLQLPTSPDKAGGGTVGMCSTPSHKCAACDGNRPYFEFGPADSKICLHEKCYRLWIELEKKPN